MSDLISRDAAIEAVVGWETDPTDEELEIALMNVPTIDAIPVEWVEKRLNDMLKGSFSFEECGAIAALLSDWRKGREAKQ